eukprot:1662565-Prymnesium_polylepis.1
MSLWVHRGPAHEPKSGYHHLVSAGSSALGQDLYYRSSCFAVARRLGAEFRLLPLFRVCCSFRFTPSLGLSVLGCSYVTCDSPGHVTRAAGCGPVSSRSCLRHTHACACLAPQLLCKSAVRV